MDLTQDTLAPVSSAPASSAAPAGTTGSDRRGDVETKQLLAAALLREVGCDSLLVLEPENFAWLSAGGTARGVLDPEALPALFYSAESRWAVCANVDTQRLFDEELDGLGFQLKEWPWHWGRKQLLADLCHGRATACDRAFANCMAVGEALRKRRLVLSEYEKACYIALGQLLSHALEATCRTLSQGETEREIAGQLSHRLLHRGAFPLTIMISADGRSHLYRQGSFTAMPVRQSCLVLAAARKYGLCAMASRSVCFGKPDASLRKEHDAVCRVSASYIAASWPDAMPRQILHTARRVYQATDFEHDWLLAPQGHVTGRAPVEMPLTPQTEELLQNHWALTWNATAGAAGSCDTVLVTEQGPQPLTPVENWPLKRIRIHGTDFLRPDILVR